MLHSYSFSFSESSSSGFSGCTNSRSAFIETNRAADKTLFLLRALQYPESSLSQVLREASILMASVLKLPRKSVHINPHTENSLLYISWRIVALHIMWLKPGFSRRPRGRLPTAAASTNIDFWSSTGNVDPPNWRVLCCGPAPEGGKVLVVSISSHSLSFWFL